MAGGEVQIFACARRRRQIFAITLDGGKAMKARFSPPHGGEAKMSFSANLKFHPPPSFWVLQILLAINEIVLAP